MIRSVCEALHTGFCLIVFFKLDRLACTPDFASLTSRLLLTLHSYKTRKILIFSSLKALSCQQEKPDMPTLSSPSITYALCTLSSIVFCRST